MLGWSTFNWVSFFEIITDTRVEEYSVYPGKHLILSSNTSSFGLLVDKFLLADEQTLDKEVCKVVCYFVRGESAVFPVPGYCPVEHTQQGFGG